MAEEMDVDYIVLGSYNFDGRTFTSHAQLLDVKRIRISPESVETGGLAQLVQIQDATAWDLLHDAQADLVPDKNTYLGAQTPVRLDALENYVRGSLAGDRAAKIKYFKDAVRISPDYSQAAFQLAKTYFDNKEYEQAAPWFAKVPRSTPLAGEANFFLGMAYYYTGNFEKAEEAFSFVAAHVPLIEVYNNLGVVAGRRGKKSATELFDRVVQADSRDPDYRFNYALALARSGDIPNATRQLKEALAIKPQDSEAKSLLDSLSKGAVPAKLPLERVKSNYDETSYRQLAAEIQNANEERHSKMPPAEHAAAHAERGREFLQQGFFDQAESEFRQAMLASPSSVDAHAGLARALEEQDQLPEARTEAVAANRIKFTADAFVTLAKIDLKQNKLESARDNADRALKLDPSNAAANELKKTIASQLAARPQSTQKNQP
jgi:tetratricopeptide (TPR) repeat protein